MPTVPTLEAPAVQQEGLPGRAFPRIDDNVSPASFGAGVGQGIEEVGSAQSQVQAKYKQDADRDRVIDANTQLEAAQTALLYGQTGPDGQRQGGAYSLHGANAIDMPNKYLPHYDEVAAKITGTLTPDQQQLFLPHVANGRAALNLQLNHYEYKEHDALSDTIYASGVAQEKINAALGWRDPNIIAKSTAGIIALVDMQADRAGLPPGPARDQLLLKDISEMHNGVVGSMLATGKFQAAQGYLNAHFSEMDPKASESAQRMIYTTQEHALVMSDKLERDTSNALLKDAIKKSMDGTLTPAYIEAHHNTWEPQAYEYAYKLLSGKEATTDPHTFAPLLSRAMGGEDVTKEAQDALYSNKLTLPDYDKIVQKSESPRKGYVARGADYISTSLKPSALVQDPAGQRSTANALSDWHDWTDEHPNAEPVAAENAYKSITNHYQIISADKATVFMPVPLHLIGSRLQPDIASTWAATKAAHDSGDMGDAEYQRQALLIQQWVAAMAKKTPPKATP